MKYLKMLGLAAVGAMALMAITGAGSASATTLTCTEGASKVQCPAGTEIVASADGSGKLTAGGITITCTEGSGHGTIENPGSSTETASGKTGGAAIILGSCPNCTVIEITNGTLEIHTENNGSVANGNGTLTGSGFTAHFTCFGVTCNYVTGNNLDLGTLTGSSTTGGTATMDVNTNLTKQAGSSFLCGSTATLEGSSKVTTPDWLDVD